MKSTTVEAHLAKTEHVQLQLAKAGTNITLYKGQWCKAYNSYLTKTNTSKTFLAPGL